MKKYITRRDLLKFAGGTAVGILFTPVPWKLLDDTAIWSQNWGLIPKLPHGPITTLYSVCTLCPAGCPVKARCINGMPYGLSGVANHPISHGYLCARGLSGHHLAYHPLRVTIPHKFSSKGNDSRLQPLSLDQTVSELAARIQNAHGSVVFLNRNPQNGSTGIYQQFVQKLPKGIHAELPSNEDATLRALQHLHTKDDVEFKFNFADADLIISFAAPLLDNFGTPGNVARLLSHSNNVKKEYIQIEAIQSASALKANQWIPVKPGSEGILALSIANILVTEDLITQRAKQEITDYDEYVRLVKKYSPVETASATTVSPETVRKLAFTLASSRSSILLSGADPGGGPFHQDTDRAIAGLNVLLGNIGKTISVCRKPRTSLPPLQDWSELDDHSISVLIIDGSETGYAYPWELIERKLVPNQNVVVTLSPFVGESAAHADYIIPTTTYYESVAGISSDGSLPYETFSIARPILPKQEGTIEQQEFILRLSSALGLSINAPASDSLLKERVNEIYSGQHGTVFSVIEGTSTPVHSLSGVDELYSTLYDGGIWIGNLEKGKRTYRFALSIHPENMSGVHDALVLIPSGRKGEISSTTVSPIMSKIFQESELHFNANTVLMNPSTMARKGLSENCQATVRTSKGSLPVVVHASNAVPPDVINAWIGPLPNNSSAKQYFSHTTVLSLCDVTTDGTWRITDAEIVGSENT